MRPRQLTPSSWLSRAALGSSVAPSHSVPLPRCWCARSSPRCSSAHLWASTLRCPSRSSLSQPWSPFLEACCRSCARSSLPRQISASALISSQDILCRPTPGRAATESLPPILEPSLHRAQANDDAYDCPDADDRSCSPPNGRSHVQEEHGAAGRSLDAAAHPAAVAIEPLAGVVRS